MSNREPLKSALERMTRGLVDAILVAIRDASVAEIGHASGAARARPGPSAGARPRPRADVVTAAAAKRAGQAGRERRASAEPKPANPVRAAIARRQARARAAGRPDARAWDDAPDAGGGTAITDPESVLAAFGGEGGAPRAPATSATEGGAHDGGSATRRTREKPAHVDAHAGAGASTTMTTASAGSAPATPSSSGGSAAPAGPARPSLPALRENETALRTASGGTVIRRKRSPVRAA
jgi:hypothetical protein